MKRVGDVLGKDWELYAESQKLQSESTLFKEVRNLLWLNFQVPHAITDTVKDTNPCC